MLLLLVDSAMCTAHAHSSTADCICGAMPTSLYRTRSNAKAKETRRRVPVAFCGAALHRPRAALYFAMRPGAYPLPCFSAPPRSCGGFGIVFRYQFVAVKDVHSYENAPSIWETIRICSGRKRAPVGDCAGALCASCFRRSWREGSEGAGPGARGPCHSAVGVGARVGAWFDRLTTNGAGLRANGEGFCPWQACQRRQQAAPTIADLWKAESTT